MNVRAVEHKLLEEQLSKIHNGFGCKTRNYRRAGVRRAGGGKVSWTHSRTQEVFDYTTISLSWAVGMQLPLVRCMTESISELLLLLQFHYVAMTRERNRKPSRGSQKPKTMVRRLREL